MGVVIVINVRVTVFNRGRRVLNNPLEPWRLILPRGQVALVPERERA
jgi:hypothetical protein